MQTPPTNEINWLVLALQIGIPSLVAALVPLIAYSWIAKRMKNYETSLAAELKSLESSLNRNLEEYKLKLIETARKERNRLEKLEELHLVTARFMQKCAAFAQEVVLMAAKGYDQTQYQTISAAHTSSFAEINTKLRLYCPEATSDYTAMSMAYSTFKGASSEYLIEPKEDRFDEITRRLFVLNASCIGLLEKIETSAKSLADN